LSKHVEIKKSSLLKDVVSRSDDVDKDIKRRDEVDVVIVIDHEG
jgi:hypothetical protein